MSFFQRPRRVVQLRTRLSSERALQGVAALVARPDPHSLRGGSVATTEFQLEYRFAAPKNTQDYLVHGRIEDTQDWRLVRLELQARDPWIHPLMILMVPLVLGVPVYVGELSLAALVAITAALVGFYAFLNLLYVPDTVARRVTRLVAEAVKGTVVTGS